MTTNLFIDTVLFQVLDNTFGGTFSSNNCPILNKRVKSIVCNLSPEKTPGTHFVGFYLEKNKLYYIDSLSTHLDLLPQNIKNWIKRVKHNTVIEYYKIPIQSQNSNFCGFFVINALMELHGAARKRTLYNKKLLKSNDEKCINSILSKLKKRGNSKSF